MGISALTDAVTGLIIPADAPTVVVVIASIKKGYPDPVKAAARPAVGINHQFEAFSLPIFGKAGDYSDFEPTGEQLSVQTLLAISGVKTWKEFSETALNWQKGISLPDEFAWMRKGAAPPPEPEILGLFAVAESTFHSLVVGSRNHQNKQADIEMVLEALDDAVANQLHDRDRYYALPVVRLSDSHHEYSDGRIAHLPRIAAALSSMDFDGALGSRLVRLLADRKFGLLSQAINAATWADHRPRLASLLDQLHDWQSFASSLGALNRYLMPSASGGQYSNHREVAQLGLASVRQSVDMLVNHHKNEMIDDDKLADQVGTMLNDLESLTVDARELLDRALERSRSEDHRL